ncbi:LysR family transcriptional regulator [Agrobacterium bohemicum]|uniref:LysR family transcriptional regulator n=1 Tax=Agrobacterium bohemicum TaxID=2052828 RepID=A0A135P662_9HYPH|nr:LysR family transcriptional regulator [Agrobacterium bohemicum]KXG86923.1 LysR family transcriptional regulator [Agrobacterium bohemicum]
MKDVNWDDLKLFHIVAAQGGLAGAAGLTGTSAPTIGRRMLLLERSIGRTLFIRSPQGYRLAPDGMTLFERVQSMQKAASDISQWHGNAFSLPIVSVASNIWLMGFVSDNAAVLRGPQDPFRLCCKCITEDEDLTFRRGMVAIFDTAPKNGNFAVRKSVTMTYHAYRAAHLSFSDDMPWISIGTEVAVSDAEKWVFRNHEATIHTWTNAPELLPKLIASGAGRGILPSFLGDAMPGLVRNGEAIEELSHPLWLTVNDDDRHTPEMRLLIDRLAALLKRNEALFDGTLGVERDQSEGSVIPFHRS